MHNLVVHLQAEEFLQNKKTIWRNGPGAFNKELEILIWESLMKIPTWKGVDCLIDEGFVDLTEVFREYSLFERHIPMEHV